MLKKGILLGLGLNNTNKKHIKDFVDDLYKKGYLGYDEAEELFKTLIAKAKNQREAVNAHMEDQIKNYIKEYDELIYEHLLYLERRVEHLEDELERIQLEKELENMSDEDLEKLISEFEADLGKDKKVKAPKDKKGKKRDQDKLIDDVLSTEHDLNEKKLEELLFGKSGKVPKLPKVKKVKKAKKSKKKKAKKVKVKAPKVKAPKKEKKAKKKKAPKVAKKKNVKKIKKKK
jgi:polyhydroxyalkanoate synthesis regulator phasin